MIAERVLQADFGCRHSASYVMHRGGQPVARTSEVGRSLPFEAMKRLGANQIQHPMDL
jgi:hypothetical protein